MKKLLAIVVLCLIWPNLSLADHGIFIKNHNFIKPCIIILVLCLFYIAWFNFDVDRKEKRGETADSFEAISYIAGPGLIFVISLIAAFISGFILIGFYFWPVVIGIIIFVIISLVGTRFLTKKK